VVNIVFIKMALAWGSGLMFGIAAGYYIYKYLYPPRRKIMTPYKEGKISREKVREAVKRASEKIKESGEGLDLPSHEGSYVITRPDGATFKGYAYWCHRSIPATLIYPEEIILKWFNN